MNAVVNFNGLNLEVLEFDDTWALSNRQVADGFGVSEEAIRQQKSRGEYKYGIHFFTERVKHDGMGGVTICHGGVDTQEMTFWTKKGVITLGFKLRETPQTIAFRDWASDFILRPNNIIPKSNPYLDKLINNMGSLHEKIDKLQAKNSALAGELIEASRKYTAALERENELLRSARVSDTPLNAPVLVGTGRKFSPSELQRAQKLKAQGLTNARIAQALGRNLSTVARNLRRARRSEYGLFGGAL